MDIIQLLPDSIANQIAAGEVVQRPASVVKELIENSIDANSTSIQLIIKNAGKLLIQVIDDGSGMSETDARMCFSRHATSKIKTAKDLFSIRTKGFRGEALASIAAISHVELKTRSKDQELGNLISISGSKVKKQEYCQTAIGTSIAVKNLFYNIPARRNFLKSDPVETRHIIDEFQRLALAHPDIFFQLFHNGEEIYHLPSTKLRQRIVGVFGKSINDQLVPVEENTDIVKISGYIGKPESARKKRGEQFFFVNKRFIRSPYLNHAVKSAFENLLPEDHHPFYILFLEIDPAKIDVNVHPTKQEIKFQEERLIYNLLKASVKHALGQFNIVPSLDFEGNPLGDYSTPRSPTSASNRQSTGPSDGWKSFYEGLNVPSNQPKEAPDSVTLVTKPSQIIGSDPNDPRSEESGREPVQILNGYLIIAIKSGLMVLDQRAAHERILYERFMEQLTNAEVLSQRELFPTTLELNQSDALMLNSILEKTNQLGFDIQNFGGNTFIIHAVPANLTAGHNPEEMINQLIQQYRLNLELNLELDENIARSLASSTACKRGQKLSLEEMKSIIDQLFACEMPFKTPTGRNCFITFDKNKLERLFSG